MLATVVAAADGGSAAAARWLRGFVRTRAGFRPAVRWLREHNYDPTGKDE